MSKGSIRAGGGTINNNEGVLDQSIDGNSAKDKASQALAPPEIKKARLEAKRDRQEEVKKQDEKRYKPLGHIVPNPKTGKPDSTSKKPDPPP